MDYNKKPQSSVTGTKHNDIVCCVCTKPDDELLKYNNKYVCSRCCSVDAIDYVCFEDQKGNTNQMQNNNKNKK